MSDTKKNWLDKTGVIHLWNTIKALLDTKVDKIEGLGLSSNDYTVEDKTKVSKIKPVQNTLTSTDTEAGLSAAQGKVLKDIVDTKADNINVQPITIPTTGWGTENGVSSYPNYIDIPLAGVSSKDAVVIDISPSSAYFAAQAQFTNTESMDGAVRIRAKNVPTAAIKGQWYVIHGGGTVYEGELHNYYDKSEMEALLAGKLDLTGGTMAGKLEFTSYMVRGGSILLGEEDAANAPGEPLNNLVIRSWNGVSFTTDCPNQTYTGKTAVGIDCREGIVKAVKFEGTADNSIKWDNLFLRRKHNTSDTWIPVFSDNNVDYVLKNEIANLNGVAASGSNYVRFTDGTQICWGILQSTVTFPVAFATTSYGVSVSGTATIGIPSFPYVVKKTVTNMEISNNNGDSYIAIGRWK